MDNLKIYCEAVLDILGHDHDPAVQLISDGERIGVIGEQTNELTQAMQDHKAELLHHFDALAKLQQKYNDRLHIEQQLEKSLNQIGYPGWKDDPAFTEWQALTRELSHLINRLETLLGREVTPEEATKGFANPMQTNEE